MVFLDQIKKTMKTISNFRNEYAFLSNFFKSPIVDGRYSYPTAEHYFQAQKSDLIEDQSKVRNAPTARDAKRLGRTLTLRKDWKEVKDEVMLMTLVFKFIQNKGLLSLLRKTEGSHLIEGNTWHDNYWGDCFCEKCKEVEGQNKLGETLMIVRKNL